ncbi:MAG TPA: glucose-6-phosphate isomerase [Bacteroidales bacterium]|jgi:glucose-6-phosphate isomerase|nr:glucose-6-phosphate isomerase [Bacteroidales bacterium]
MGNMTFFYEDVLSFIQSESLLNQGKVEVEKAYKELVTKRGKGNDFLGWLDLPINVTENEINKIKSVAKQLIEKSEVIVVVGIGGSYLGARAVIEALQPYFNTNENGEKTTEIVYAGTHLSEDYLHDLLHWLNNKEYSIIIISKSGTTTEPALAFRLLKTHCEKKYGKNNAQRRIVAITDKSRGVLKRIANSEGYQTFVIPDDVGGRYSVLTPVGLLPIAAAGFDIAKLLLGAKKMRQQLYEATTWQQNPAMQYALLRYLLYTKENRKIELMVSYEPKLLYFIEWFKQLFGESEGKEGKGIFPAGAVFSTDLHSLGQYIQEGERIIFETVLSVKNSQKRIPIPYLENNEDELNYLQSKSIQEINLIAEKGTRLAHIEGEVPNFTISISKIDEETLGEMIFFFEFSCALGGYLLDVNPFDQPGVEAYKKNMFKLLGK